MPPDFMHCRSFGCSSHVEKQMFTSWYMQLQSKGVAMSSKTASAHMQRANTQPVTTNEHSHIGLHRYFLNLLIICVLCSYCVVKNTLCVGRMTSLVALESGQVLRFINMQYFSIIQKLIMPLPKKDFDLRRRRQSIALSFGSCSLPGQLGMKPIKSSRLVLHILILYIYILC